MEPEIKTFKVQLLKKGDLNSVGYISKALKDIRSNPNSHGYSDKEVKRLFKIENDFVNSIKPYEEAINSITKIFKDFETALKKFKDSFGSVISQFQNLSKTGWFISPELIRDYSLEELLSLSHNPSADWTERIILNNHGNQSEIESIFKSLKTTFPNRKTIFEEISKCYELGLFSAVITLSYTQADGICNEVWNYGFFDKDATKSYKTKLFLELNNIELGFSSHFVTQLGISENEIIRNSKDLYFKETKVKENSSNRHLVLHGHSTNYGTRGNALKAILLLNFLEHFVIEYRKGSS
jgi:hypothetical protein